MRVQVSVALALEQQWLRQAETRLQDGEWSKADMEVADQEGESSPMEGAAHSEAAESQDS